ncbi:MAG TPA: prepilin-type N-terminal cleavage/methylation domain-containing protein, partial [Armatimonadota bacterium]|nr:prepilin-type N-terminal cleavage/methylation domain-containing protein [Armatimonadota bacterium]
MNAQAGEWRRVVKKAATPEKGLAIRQDAPSRFPVGMRGMTLAELLVAMTILAILFALLFMPLLKSFGFIHTSNVRMEAQNVGRSLFESLTREMSDATYIYDNLDDPTQSSLVMVLPQGAGANANQPDPSNPTAPPNKVPMLLVPGPGMDYSVTTPLHVHYQLALTKAQDKDGNPLPYSNEWEMESADLRGTAQLPPPTVAQQGDNLYRLFRGEYYPNQDSAVTPDPQAARFLLTRVLGSLYPGQSGFRDPGALIDDSLLTRKRSDTVLRDSVDVAKRRKLLEDSGLLIGLTPRQDMDIAWATYTPDSSGNGAWAVKPGIRFESKQVQNEAMDAVAPNGVAYPSAYRSDYGHWQMVRRQSWASSTAMPLWARFYQVFDVSVDQYYNSGTPSRRYYLSIGRTDSSIATSGDSYYVFRKTGAVGADPVEGPWPAADVPVFNLSRYLSKIDIFRQGPGSGSAGTFWNDNNPYDTTLFSSDANDPYWPEMGYLLDAEHGSVSFRLDAPVRPPVDSEPQPPGPLAPFQVPYNGS